MNDEEWGAGMLQTRGSIQLAANEELDAGQEPKHFASEDRCGRERRVENDSTYRKLRGEIRGYGGSKRLAERNDRLRVDLLYIDEVLVSGLSVEIHSRL